MQTRLWWVLTESAFDGSLENGAGGRFFVGVVGRNLASVAVVSDYFSKGVKNKFYKFCVFSAICKDNAEIHSVTF
jgi:hypothetical protein